jgi:hypothetical protein
MMHSLCTHYALTMHSLCTHYALTTLSLRSQYALTVLSLRSHYKQVLIMSAMCSFSSLLKVQSINSTPSRTQAHPFVPIVHTLSYAGTPFRTHCAHPLVLKFFLASSPPEHMACLRRGTAPADNAPPVRVADPDAR